MRRPRTQQRPGTNPYSNGPEEPQGEGWLGYEAWCEQHKSKEEAERARTKTRFLADENVSQEVVDELRHFGIDLASVLEEGIRGHEDEDVIALARRMHRVVLTHDRDFWSDHKTPLNSSPGIVFVVESETSAAITALALFFERFVREVDSEAFNRMKARLNRSGWYVRYIERRGEEQYIEATFTKDRKLFVRCSHTAPVRH